MKKKKELTIEPKYQGEISKPCIVDLIQLVEDLYIANHWEGSFPTPSCMCYQLQLSS